MEIDLFNVYTDEDTISIPDTIDEGVVLQTPRGRTKGMMRWKATNMLKRDYDFIRKISQKEYVCILRAFVKEGSQIAKQALQMTGPYCAQGMSSMIYFGEHYDEIHEKPRYVDLLAALAKAFGGVYAERLDKMMKNIGVTTPLAILLSGTAKLKFEVTF